MESTDLRDKNYDEIFVGDILEDDIGNMFIVGKEGDGYVICEDGNPEEFFDDLNEVTACVLTKVMV